jgi:hypothetical protein
MRSGEAVSINFAIGHVVRTFPVSDGAFDVATVIGFDGERLLVRFDLINGHQFPDEIWPRSDVEMFAFMGKNGMYELGDTVTVDGYEGKWIVEKFAQDPRSTETEWCAALLHKNGTRLLWPAHLIMKVDHG